MEADEAPDDDQVRYTYNFAPGYNGVVYRADVPDYGAGGEGEDDRQDGDQEGRRRQRGEGEGNKQNDQIKAERPEKDRAEQGVSGETRYKLQAMKWGLIPFWTKRNPDYGTLMRTINCRDDSLIEDRGMWTSMKRRKRCIVVCQGFYEWLKKNNGKERMPHFVRRKDEQLLCFAGLWDCVKYEGSDESIYSYTVITTSVSSQLRFLHDRMPVILEPGSDAMRLWLDPHRTWSSELQNLLKPYEGDALEVYPVSKDVGKVGNNSPSFIVPIDSKSNKSNIANFFGNQKKLASRQGNLKDNEEEDIKQVEDIKQQKQQAAEEEKVSEVEGITEGDTEQYKRGIKRAHDGNLDEQASGGGTTHEVHVSKVQRTATSAAAASADPTPPSISSSPQNPQPVGPATATSPRTPAKTSPTKRQTRSATSNTNAAATGKKGAGGRSAKGSPQKGAGGNAKITAFFGK